MVVREDFFENNRNLFDEIAPEFTIGLSKSTATDIMIPKLSTSINVVDFAKHGVKHVEKLKRLTRLEQYLASILHLS